MHHSPSRPGLPATAIRLGLALGLALAPAAIAGCDRHRVPEARSMSLPVDVLSDSGRGGTLHVAPPRTVRVWVQRVTPAPPAAIDAGLPAAESDSVSVEPPPAPALVVDEGLKPPIPRMRARIARTGEGGPASVDLDVRVSESGAVTDARWAGGSERPSLVAAARDCALAMRFYPALKDGKPIAVWCRQRFDFGGLP